MRKGKTNTEFGRGGELNTIIGKGTKIQGDMQVQNSLRVDGSITGNITSTDTVIIGKDGRVEGKVKGKHVLLGGEIRGNIVAKGKVFLEMTSSIIGDITASQLVIDEGAVFDGKCRMKDVPKTDETNHDNKDVQA